MNGTEYRERDKQSTSVRALTTPSTEFKVSIKIGMFKRTKIFHSEEIANAWARDEERKGHKVIKKIRLHRKAKI